MRPDRLSCAHCGREGTAEEVATGWSLSTPPRATGAPERAAPGPLTALCPACARGSVRDLEARLDP